MPVRRWILVAAALLVLTGCPRHELYMVMPNADGSPGSGAVSVTDGKNSMTIDQAWGSGEMRQEAAGSTQVPESDAKIIFHEALYAQPVLPHRFRLFFELGSDELTPESMAAYQEVVNDLKSRKAYEVAVTGHTDTLSGEAYNDRLSLERAAAIRDRLVADGFSAAAISIDGRGELEPLVATDDQMAEPRNRRVEILIR